MLLLLGGASLPAQAQTTWAPLVSEDFGTGSANVSATPATQLLPGTTNYTPKPTPGWTIDGSYSVTKNPDFVDDPGGGVQLWQHGPDHTTGTGYMATFNANPARRGESVGTYYLYTASVRDVPGAFYRMRYWGANILAHWYSAAGGATTWNAYVGLTVRDQPNGGGTLYAQEPNSAIPFPRAVGNQNHIPWQQRTMTFQLPTTYSGSALYFNFYNSSPANVTNEGNDLAIDDIVIEMASATVSGRIYLDNNQDGNYNPGAGDALLTGALPYVAAIDANGSVVDFAQIAADGTYTLNAVPWSSADIGVKLVLLTSAPTLGQNINAATIPAGFGVVTETPNATYGSTGSQPRDGILNVLLTTDPSGVHPNFNIGLSARPIVRVRKITQGGVNGPFGFTGTNLDSPIANITTTIADTAQPASPVANLATTANQSVQITESTVAANWTQTAVTCVDANSAASGNTNPVATATTGPVTLPAAAVRHQSDITCTFQNTGVANLTIRKNVTNDNGGVATVADFGIQVDGVARSFGANTGTAGNAVYTSAAVAVNAGTRALTELNVAGYTEGTWACTGTGVTMGNAAFDSGSVTLAAGADATCTITNDDTPASLTLRKAVVNDNGGTAAQTAWTLNAAGPTPISGTHGAAAVTNAAVGAGTYALSESGGPAGYTASAYSCSVDGGAAVSGNSLTLANGQNAVCTITNDDAPAQLTLQKVVVNDNGGAAVATAWTLNANGPTPISGTHAAAAVTNATVGAGTYTLSESGGPAGYTASAYSCSIDGGAAVSGNSLTLANGQNAVCTITNDDAPANLTLRKTVVNNNGGTAAATAWTLNAAGPTPISGTHGSAAVTNAAVGAGTYTLSETGPAGYNPSAWVCTNGVTVTGGNQITLANGATTDCTITNDDRQAQLTLLKRVINDNGGTRLASAWTLRATGPTAVSGTPPVLLRPVNAGTYTLSETGPGGYAASAWTCTNGVTVTGGNQITLPPGGATSCQITNDDRPATLTLQKIVVNDNGGTAVATAWTLNAAGPTPISGAHGAAAVTGAAVNAGTYALSESGGPADYTASAYSCSIDGGAAVSGDSLTLANGQSAVCTVTNDDSNEADLSITKSNTYTPADPSDQAGDTVVAGTPTTYTLVVTNNGPATAVGAVVRDVPQAGLDCPASNPVACSGAACPSAAITIGDLGSGITLGSLATGATATLSFTCAVQQ
ncbi:hypothetical protein RDV84_21280 [Lysobacter yananisis]|uniref:DUF11 domain-containing protein n=1 Tax=Lysobacter yananisis TaxID=1003114 RepID=A0ABY9P5Y5_9GAMM|nr:hypothetical protein [Lysobacter yananisis]WMT02467.1 hypothetical protein RDV84_21280 [Lysobacter yananisis]